ncbi:hypothetical protein ABT063_00650 [Streptomyces sp. NPDC002838]|uniref:hypothetical protein n=1 Tax=Streptomyces sp. NPDC002838 TaxID=3154436 RepID=UPI003325EB0F
MNWLDADITYGALKDVALHELPITLGRDFAWIVEAVGEGISEVEVGDEIFGAVPHGGDRSRRGLGRTRRDRRAHADPQAHPNRHRDHRCGRADGQYGDHDGRCAGPGTRRHCPCRGCDRRDRRHRRTTRPGGRCDRPGTRTARGRRVPARLGRERRARARGWPRRRRTQETPRRRGRAPRRRDRVRDHAVRGSRQGRRPYRLADLRRRSWPRPHQRRARGRAPRSSGAWRAISPTARSGFPSD